ncbi:extracellular solute-binding protein [Saccharopolyspora erythraea]|uniref:ABC transporter substrate-binding protein n=1 Tax=Saccharopolyspora erythraea TaxID=1836 RepID=UPI001BA9E472|nr:extracellular solute-binding protein [Saccharopolyspora erythraea]QUH01831.1 extracellular solute-binding protein [Saccharopolyspora erythraea]
MVAVAGCGGTRQGAAHGNSITYAFWGSPSRAKKVNAVIELFGARHPGARIRTQVADYSSYVEGLTVRAAGGGLACALGMQSTFCAQYAEAGLLRPLDDLTESGQIDVSNIPDDVLAAGRVDGVQYMIPTGTFVRILGYNADLVASSGATAPTSDMTWDNYAAFLREMQRGLPDGVRATEIEATNMFTLTSWVVGHGERMFDGDRLGFGKSLLAEWFQLWLELTSDGVTVPPSAIPKQTGSVELTPLAQGTAAIGTRDIPHLHVTEQVLAANERGTAISEVSMPSPEVSRSANVLGANGIAISADCGDVATTAAFIDFFTNNAEAALAFKSDNGIVTNVHAQDVLIGDSKTPQGVKRNVTTWRALTEARDLTTTTYPAGLPSLTTELARLYERVAFDRMSVDEAVDAFFSTAEHVLG